MSISGNTVAKYLVMVSQVIAWCTVSVMLLRRGLHQVHAVAQQPPLYDNGTSDGNRTATAVPADGRQPEVARSFDETGTPAVVAGVIMIAIAVIMLIISPTIMLMKMIEKRKKRILEEVSGRPPFYRI